MSIKRTIILASVILAGGVFPGSADAQAPAEREKVATRWEWCGWGGGGYFWSCAADPSDANVFYLTSDITGLWKSTDRCKSWRFINQGIADYCIYSIAISRSNPQVLYIMDVDGMCKTVDGGNHWKRLEQTDSKKLDIAAIRDGSVRAIAIDPKNADIVYAGSKHGLIFKTMDGGETWRKLEYNQASAGEAPGKQSGVISSICVSTKNPKLVCASSTASPILRSTDAGATWVALKTPKNAAAVAIAPSDDQIMYAAFREQGVMKTTDGGETWTAASSGMDPKYLPREIAVHPADPNKVVCVANKGWDGICYQSGDGGTTWKGETNFKADHVGNPTAPEKWVKMLPPGCNRMSTLTCIAISEKIPDQVLISANWSPVFSADGGKTWEESAKGADVSVVMDVFFLKGKTYAAAMDQGLLVSENSGTTWRQLIPLAYDPETGGHQFRVLAMEKNGTEKIISTLSSWVANLPNRVLLSEDGGKAFKLIKDGLPNYRSYANCLWGPSYPKALAVDHSNPDILYLGMDGDPEPGKEDRKGGGIFKSIDGGYTWKQLENQPGSRKGVFGLAVDPTNPKRIYWGACGTGGGVRVSEDAGESWSQCTARYFANYAFIFNLTVTPKGTVLCGCGNNLWASQDHGKTWQNLTKKPGYSVPVVGIAVDPQNENRIWISSVTWATSEGGGGKTIGGIEMTEDGGKTWKDITGNTPYVKPMHLRYNPETKELWAAGSCLFKTKM
ncbi:MAG: YCF48-related protein [Verrucomicrobiota bacterium]